ncbi:MAG: hypothetical protein ABI147_08025 [Acidobacteriaceae bacterium]
MPDMTKSRDTARGTTKRQDKPKGGETPAAKELGREADEAATRAGKTEQRYDEDHDIFTK